MMPLAMPALSTRARGPWPRRWTGWLVSETRFERDYGAMLEGVLERGLATAVCTIYDARFSDPLRRRLAATGLTIFNDCITREAFSRALPLIDLRLICNEDEDFANPIEPSVRGGLKIAAAIAALAAEHDFAQHRSEVFA
jgi:hypothetical protein